MSFSNFNFEPATLPACTAELRREVRQFLAEEISSGGFVPDSHGWARTNPAFSRKLGARGWIGMTWPKRYGGHERDALERYVVTEELLAGGAPVRGHWTADRQTGPLILEFGTEAQRMRFLPEIAAGRCNIAIGLSEPDSGSDLAAIRTKAVKVAGGWKIDGSKLWTSNAHNAQYMTAFVRTSSDPDNRHAGVSRFLVDMTWRGVAVKPIINMTGEHDLNEVTFDDVYAPDDMLIGEAGAAWKQIGTELAHERSAPDRWLASHDLLLRAIDAVGPDADRMQRGALGRTLAHLWTLQNMSVSIAGLLQRGLNPSVEASIVKDLATHYDQDVPRLARELIGEDARARLPDAEAYADSLHYNLLYAPALTIKGGTREILRNNIARALGLR
jgi:acyl-CoA dehydrogenase